MSKSGRDLVVSSTLLRLRELASSDLALTFAWRNDADSVRWFKSGAPLEWDAHLSWFERYSSSRSPDCMYFAETLAGRPVGQLSIYNFDSECRTAEVGRFLSAPEVRGTGVFREALILGLLLAFEVIGLEAVHLEVMEENKRAIRLYQSVGFVEHSRAGGLVSMGLARTMLPNFQMQISVASLNQEGRIQ